MMRVVHVITPGGTMPEGLSNTGSGGPEHSGEGRTGDDFAGFHLHRISTPAANRNSHSLAYVRRPASAANRNRIASWLLKTVPEADHP